MRTDDPQILKQIQQLEQTAETLRRLCGFPPLVELPETRASRQPHWCPECTMGFQSAGDLEHHLVEDHSD
ncbi:MAG TPA: hypothetical protein VFB50_01005 [Chloroflexota bacterium]|nr:hypothetical protein [Chloroflexota bacterium]